MWACTYPEGSGAVSVYTSTSQSHSSHRSGARPDWANEIDPRWSSQHRVIRNPLSRQMQYTFYQKCKPDRVPVRCQCRTVLACWKIGHQRMLTRRQRYPSICLGSRRSNSAWGLYRFANTRHVIRRHTDQKHKIYHAATTCDHSQYFDDMNVGFQC